MTLPARILVVDDEPNIRLTLGALLQRAGHTVANAEDGAAAVALLDEQSFDLLLVDLKMPGMGGMEVVAAARQRQPDIAIIVLTGHGSLDTAIEGLHQGVFDYLLKTTAPAEVIERVHAGLEARAQNMRQRQLIEVVGTAVEELRGAVPQPAVSEADAQRLQQGAQGARFINIGDLQLDPWRQEAKLAERRLPLTPTEFRVLLCLAEHAGTALSYTQLVRGAQGYDTTDDEAAELIKPHIHHLRQKLEPDASTPRYILTVRGKGYMLAPSGE
jgi:DNA-binding response OmpR family regulator